MDNKKEKLRAYNAKYYKENCERIKENTAVYVSANKEKISENKKKYYSENKSKIKHNTSEWAKKNPKKRDEIEKKFHAKNQDYLKKRAAAYRASHPEKTNASVAKYRTAHPEVLKIQTHNRRVRKISNGGKLSIEAVPLIFLRQKGKCAICRTSLKKTSYHLDHIVPLFRGGKNINSNIQLTCPKCNLSKGSKDPIQFMQERGFLL